MTEEGEAPVIIVRKVRNIQREHGGSWKVAYADFVTALMALFIVLWILGQSKEVKRAVSVYFTHPSLTPRQIAMQLGHKRADPSFEKKLPPRPPTLGSGPVPLSKLADRIRGALEAQKWKAQLRGQIIIKITPEGLRIELVDFANSPFFNVGSAIPRPQTRQALKAIGAQLASVPNRIVLEGYTDARPYHGGRGYSNWELSCDRANAARRLLQAAGVGPERVRAVRGYGDTHLRVPTRPYDPTNRRVSILVLYNKGAR